MSQDSDVQSPVELLAEEFLDRRQRGEKPTIDEYSQRYPEHGEEIRDVFEALLMVEDLKPGSQDGSGTFGSDEEIGGQRPEQVGGYRIVREIGRGGMGVVYEAEQQSLGRRVALKLLPRRLTGDSESVARFGREAKAAARMHHTNIVPVFEVGEDGEHVFYAMQLIQGESLDLVIDELQQLRSESSASREKAARGSTRRRKSQPAPSIAQSLVSGHFQRQRLAEEPTPENPQSADDRHEAAPSLLQQSQSVAVTDTIAFETGSTISAVLPGQSDISTADTNRHAYYRSVAQIGLQVASALSYAHARGIIHRDIKPSNLLLDAAGVVWITDFGLAKTGDDGLTRTGDVVGTIRYMSPERFRGQCDGRADVYSLGMTLYELLVLKPAFKSPDRLKLIELVSKTEPPAPRTIDPRIPRDLETIVLKCSDKDPKRRYQSADDLVDDLRRFVDDAPIKARRISVLERFARWSRRNKGLAASLSAVASLVLILAVGSTLAAGYFRTLAGTNAELADEKETALLRESRQRKETETTLYHSLVSEANSLRLARKPGYGPLVRSRLRQAMAIDTPEKDASRIRQVAVSCLGDFIANEPIVWKGLDNFTSKMALFPDSQHVALVVETSDEQGGRRVSTISIRTIPTNHETATLRIELPEKIDDLAVTPDGRQLVVCDHSGLVEVWKQTGAGTWERTGRHEPPPLFRSTGAVYLRIFPEGHRYLLCQSSGRGFTIRGLNDPKLDKSIPTPDGESLRIPSISPDGRLLAAPLRTSKTIGIWNVETGKLERRIVTQFTALIETAFTPDGHFLVCGAVDGFAMYDAKTFAQWSLVRLDSVHPITFTPDSQFMAFCTMSRRIRLWNLNSLREIAVIDHAGMHYDDPLRITPDGQWLFYADKNELRLWRLRGLPEKLTLVGHREMVPCSAFSHDGRLLATGSKDGTVRLWDAQRGALLDTFSPGYIPQSITFSPDGRLMAVGSYWGANTEHQLTLWDLRSHRRVAARTVPGGPALMIAFTSDGRQLVVCGHGLTVFDIVENKAGKNADEQIELKQRDYVPGRRSLFLALSSDDKSVVWVDRDVSLRVWDLKQRQEYDVFPKHLLLDGWHNISFLPDDRHVVFIATNGKPQVWDTKTGKMAYEIAESPRFQSFHHALSPDGRWLAGDASAEALTIIDVEAKKTLFTLPSERSPIKSVSWSPDGKRIAVGLADGGVSIWNMESIQKQLTEIALGWK